MKVGIYTNALKDKDLSVTRALVECLNKRGISYALDCELKGEIKAYEYFSISEKPKKFDFMLSVGGDGTILRIAEYCAVGNIPIAGLNLGFVGFLTEEEPEKTDSLLDRIVRGDYKTESRSLLEVNCNGKMYYALNDAVIGRDFDSRMLSVDVKVNGEFVDRYFCDGYIVSTPTGSTAYSLSAGGPIVCPRVSAFVLTSMNSHSLHSKPIVVSDSDVIELKFGQKCSANLLIDGQPRERVDNRSTVKIEKSALSVKFVRQSGNGYFNKLLTKLNKWSTTEKED